MRHPEQAERAPRSLAVTLALSASVELEGQVLELSRSGASLELWSRGDESAEPGAEVELVLDSYRLSRPLRVVCLVRDWARDGDVVHCTVGFADAAALEAGLPRELREDLTRRRHERLRLAPEIRVRIARCDGGDRVTGDMLDLSEGGMKVLLTCPLPTAREIETWERVELAFDLPDSEVRVPATVRSRFGLRVGLEFEELDAPDRERIREQMQRLLQSRRRDTSTGSD